MKWIGQTGVVDLRDIRKGERTWSKYNLWTSVNNNKNPIEKNSWDNMLIFL